MALATVESPADDGATAAQKLQQQRTLLTYATNSDEASIAANYTTGAQYESLVAQTEGLPNDPAQKFDCNNSGFFKFIQDLFIVENKTLVIEMSFAVGNANISGASAIPAAAGAPADGIPIVVLSDVSGTCRASYFRNKFVVPPTIINGNTTVGIRYTLYTTDEHDFRVFETLVGAATDVAKAINATKLVAQITAPALNQAVTDFNTKLTQNGAKVAVSTISDSFNLRKEGGVKYQWTSLSGQPFYTSIVSEPTLSLFTATIKADADKKYLPDFQGTLDPQRVYGSDLIQGYDPATGKPTWLSVADYLETTSTGGNYLTDLHNAKNAKDFGDQCNTLRTKKLAEYSSGLGLDTWDTDISLYAILAPTNWTYDSAYRDCTPKPVMDVFTAFGLDSTVRERSADIAAINTLMNSLAGRLKNGTSDQIAAFLTSSTSDSLSFDDPAGITTSASPTKREDIIKALSTLSATNVGCFAPADGSAVAERIGLIVLKDNRRVLIDVTTVSSEGDAGVAQISSIDLSPMNPADVDSVAEIKTVLATKPSKNASCGILLTKLFQDFDDVKSWSGG